MMGMDNGEPLYVELHKAHRAQIAAIAEAEIKAGDAAVRTAITLNGGAIIGILAFLGNLLSRPKDVISASDGGVFQTVLMFYAVGVLCAAITYFLAWIVNGRWYESLSSIEPIVNYPYFKDTDISQAASADAKHYGRLGRLALCVSYLLFVVASLLASDVFKHLFSHLNFPGQ